METITSVAQTREGAACSLRTSRLDRWAVSRQVVYSGVLASVISGCFSHFEKRLWVSRSEGFCQGITAHVTTGYLPFVVLLIEQRSVR